MFRIYKDVFHFFDSICQRDGIEYKRVNENYNYIEVDINVPRGRFKEIIEDIQCEKQRAGYRVDRPVYSARTLSNIEKFNRLRSLEPHKIGFSILNKDLNKLLITK